MRFEEIPLELHGSAPDAFDRLETGTVLIMVHAAHGVFHHHDRAIDNHSEIDRTPALCTRRSAKLVPEAARSAAWPWNRLRP
jgi:hypothetical protein